MQTLNGPDSKRDLGAFVRSRREHCSPPDFGITRFSRSRTPGLRRDEVAQLSGVSIAYYTWLEQGRDINPSPSVLYAIAQTLHFSSAERAYLFTLAGVDEPQPSNPTSKHVHPTLEYLLSNGEAVCSIKYDCWFNVLASTPLARVVLGLVDDHANVIETVFGDSAQRDLWSDWEAEARMLAGMYRLALARWPDDPEGAARLHRLRDSPDFERIWNDYGVSGRPSPDEYLRDEPWRLRHGLGRLSFHRIALSVPTNSRHELCLYSPADNVTAEQLHRLSKRYDCPPRTAPPSARRSVRLRRSPPIR
jgi:transcriptional regulator with XRE-family HTH domain